MSQIRIRPIWQHIDAQCSSPLHATWLKEVTGESGRRGYSGVRVEVGAASQHKLAGPAVVSVFRLIAPSFMVLREMIEVLPATVNQDGEAEGMLLEDDLGLMRLLCDYEAEINTVAHSVCCLDCELDALLMNDS